MIGVRREGMRNKKDEVWKKRLLKFEYGVTYVMIGFFMCFSAYTLGAIMYTLQPGELTPAMTLAFFNVIFLFALTGGVMWGGIRDYIDKLVDEHIKKLGGKV